MKYGSWGSRSSCPSGKNIIGFASKFEEDQRGGDDTALNSIKIKCSDGYITEASNGGPYGNWASQISQCPSGSVCGFRAKVEGDQGGGDDTSLNEIELYCC